MASPGRCGVRLPHRPSAATGGRRCRLPTSREVWRRSAPPARPNRTRSAESGSHHRLPPICQPWPRRYGGAPTGGIRRGGQALVVQRTGHRPSNPGDAGSNPAGGSPADKAGDRLEDRLAGGAVEDNRTPIHVGGGKDAGWCSCSEGRSTLPPGNRGGQWVHGVIGSAPRLQRDDSRFESGWIHAGSRRDGDQGRFPGSPGQSHDLRSHIRS